MTPTVVQIATNPISNPLQFHRLVKLVLTLQVLTSTVDQNATNPSSNPLRFHRLVRLGKPIPNDVFKSVLIEKTNSTVCQLIIKGSKLLQFNRLVILEKVIPIDVSKSSC